MRFFDDPGKALQQMEDELLEEDVDEDGEDFPVLTRRDSRPVNYAVDFDRTVYDDEERYMLLPKKKGIKGLVFLACLEILAILAILGWWLQWLI